MSGLAIGSSGISLNRSREIAKRSQSTPWEIRARWSMATSPGQGDGETNPTSPAIGFFTRRTHSRGSSAIRAADGGPSNPVNFAPKRGPLTQKLGGSSTNLGRATGPAEAPGWAHRRLFVSTSVGLERHEAPVGQLAGLRRQATIMEREFRGSEVVHGGRSVQRPASKSSSARRPASSNRPARMSISICRSH